MASNYVDLPIEGGSSGVASLNGLTGALTLVAGSGITITPSGTDITIAASGGGFVPTSRTINTTSPLAGGGNLSADLTLSISKATSLVDGYLSAVDWSTFNSKQVAGNYITALTGDGTASGPGSAALTLATVNNNVGSFGSASSVSAITVNGKGLVTAAASTAIQIAESQVTGLTTDLAGKVPATRTISTTAPITGGGDLSSNLTIAIDQSTTSTSGYLSSTDWNTFNGKQAAGSYLTALTGDGTASGPGSSAFTLATVNANVGSFGTASSVGSFTVTGKGLVTAAASTAIQIAESQVTNLVSDLAGKQPTGNYITALTGDGTASGPGSSALTLATVNSNVGTFGGSSGVPSFTVNGKGLITAASTIVSPVPSASGPSTFQTFTSIDEDWIAGGIAGSYGWTATTATGTVVVNTANISATEWGLVALTSGTTSTNAALISLNAAAKVLFGTTTAYVEMKINLSALSVPATSNYTFRAGLIDNWTGLPNNGIWFDYNTATSANWVYSTAKGGSRTQTTSSTAVATGWLKLGIVITTTTAEFFVNGTSIGAAQSSNFPNTVAVWPGIGITKGATGSANTTVLIDYYSLYASWGSSR